MDQHGSGTLGRGDAEPASAPLMDDVDAELFRIIDDERLRDIRAIHRKCPQGFRRR